MTIIDTIADAHYGDRVKMAFAFATCSTGGRALEADGRHVIQFDEPAFNVYMKSRDLGRRGAACAIDGLKCRTPCTSATATASSQRRLEGELAANRQYERRFRRCATLNEVSLECIHSKVRSSCCRCSKAGCRFGHRRGERHDRNARTGRSHIEAPQQCQGAHCRRNQLGMARSA